MKKRFVIKNTPVKLPLTNTVFYIFLLHYFKAPGFIWGIYITLSVILWTILIYVKWNEEEIDLNKEEIAEEKKAVKRTFEERLRKIKEQEKK